MFVTVIHWTNGDIDIIHKEYVYLNRAHNAVMKKVNKSGKEWTSVTTQKLEK